MSFENVVPHPATGDRTIVVSLDDTSGGQVYLYAGDKQTSGNPVERAGLAGGKLYGLKVTGHAAEDAASGIPSGARFAAHDLGDVRNKSGATLQTESVAAGVTAFQRPEDGAWDPTDPRVFYFVTTASFTEKSRLWRLTFDDPANPAGGGTIEMLLDGTEGHRMLDNLTMNERGQVMIQEAPGNQPYLGRIWRYTPRRDRLTEVAHHDPSRFQPGGSALPDPGRGIVRHHRRSTAGG
jgi:secreted PhoX family phosphatase